jgi:hypothetical protein
MGPRWTFSRDTFVGTANGLTVLALTSGCRFAKYRAHFWPGGLFGFFTEDRWRATLKAMEVPI